MSIMISANVFFQPLRQKEIFKFESQLARTLHFRFNKQVRFIQPEYRLKNISGPITVGTGLRLETGNERFFKEEIRVPGTRIRFRRFSNKNIRISVFSQNERFLLVINNPEGNSGQGHYRFVKVTNQYKSSVYKDIVSHGFSSSEVILFFTGAWKGPDPKPFSYLWKWVQEERAMHPLNAFVVQDVKWLKEVDSLWAQSRLLDFRNAPLTELLHSSDRSIVMLLAAYFEIWPGFLTPEEEQSLQHTIQLLRNDAVSFWKNAVGIEEYTPQAVWNLFGIPLMRYKFFQLISSNPDKALFLYFDSIRSGLYHLSRLYREIEDFFAESFPDILPVMRLLYLAIERLGINTNAGLLLDPYHSFKNWSFTNSDFNVAVQREHTHVKFLKYSLDIHIDKPVRFFIDPEQKRITLSPVLTSDTECNFHRCVVKLDGYQFSIPLIWRNFVLTVGRTRFRFLLKKDRFQLTIKKKTGCVSINNLDFNFDERQYQRVYLNVPGNIQQAVYNFYDLDGRTIYSPDVGMYFFKATVTNFRGLLQDSCQLKSMGRKSSKRILISQSRELPLIELKKNMAIFCGRQALFEVRNPDATECSSFIKILTNHDVAMHLQCFVDDRAKISAVRKAWYEQFAYWIPIDDFDGLIHTSSRYILIVSNIVPDWPVIREKKGCRILKPDKKNIQFCLHIRPDELYGWIKKLFIKEVL